MRAKTDARRDLERAEKRLAWRRDRLAEAQAAHDEAAAEVARLRELVEAEDG